MALIRKTTKTQIVKELGYIRVDDTSNIALWELGAWTKDEMIADELESKACSQWT